MLKGRSKCKSTIVLDLCGDRCLYAYPVQIVNNYGFILETAHYHINLISQYSNFYAYQV